MRAACDRLLLSPAIGLSLGAHNGEKKVYQLHEVAKAKRSGLLLSREGHTCMYVANVSGGGQETRKGGRTAEYCHVSRAGVAAQEATMLYIGY